MSLIVKVMHTRNAVEGGNASAPFDLYGDVTSFHIGDKPSFEDGSVFLRIWQREPIKTALVPGFAENEKLIETRGTVYVMNDNGRTVATFEPPERPAEGRVWVTLNGDRIALNEGPYDIPNLYSDLGVDDGALLYVETPDGLYCYPRDAVGAAMAVSGLRYHTQPPAAKS